MHYLQILYLTLPCFVANMLPVVAAKENWIPVFATPLDFYKKLSGKRLLGDHKTVRGLLIGIIGSVGIALLQFGLQRLQIVSLPFFTTVYESLLFGFLAGFGVLFGDAVESFFKRQIGIKSGGVFFPFDQVDYILGFVLCTSIQISWQASDILFLLVCVMILNPLVNGISYVLGIKETYW